MGDVIWTFGKLGSGKNLGHVVVKMGSCADDNHYCGDDGYFTHEHRDGIPMCECGDMWLLDHHSVMLVKS